MQKTLDELWDCAEEVFEPDGKISEILSVIKKYEAVDDVYYELLERGGMHAFSNALRVFGLSKNERTKEILWWNLPSTWKAGYNDFFVDAWAFAEDIFGNQFMFVKDGIVWMDNETGAFTYLCKTFAEWINVLINNLNYYTGASIACDWDQSHSNEKITGRFYLCPVQPFACGGSFDINNLFRHRDIECLSMKSSFARQIKDLPDGTKIQIRFSN